MWQEAYDSAITYTDLEGAWAQADAEKLAAYGVGYDGGLFQHRKSLTQWDLVALMASLEGYRIDPENADQWERDSAYSTAYSMGLLARGERDDDAVVTRASWSGGFWTAPAYRAVAGWRASSSALSATRTPSRPPTWATRPWPRAWG